MAHARVFWRKTSKKVKIYYIDYEDANGKRHREAAGPVRGCARLRDVARFDSLETTDQVVS